MTKGIKKISLLLCIQWTAQLTQYALPATRNQISRRCTPPRASTFCSDVSCTGQLIKTRQNTVPGNIDADHFLFTVLVQIVILAILGVFFLVTFFSVYFGSWKISTALICFSPQSHQKMFVFLRQNMNHCNGLT